MRKDGDVYCIEDSLDSMKITNKMMNKYAMF
jgi:hypothetical protein